MTRKKTKIERKKEKKIHPKGRTILNAFSSGPYPGKPCPERHTLRSKQTAVSRSRCSGSWEVLSLWPARPSLHAATEDAWLRLSRGLTAPGDKGSGTRPENGTEKWPLTWSSPGTRRTPAGRGGDTDRGDLFGVCHQLPFRPSPAPVPLSSQKRRNPRAPSTPVMGA